MSKTGGHSRKKQYEDNRRRCWACVVYPESCPPDWLETIGEWAVATAVSPLHNKDVNPDGQPKKPHYHVLVKFEGKKSQEQVQDLFETVKGVGAIPIQSPEGYTRYLVHKDNPEKAQYNPADIKTFGGFDLLKYLNNNADKTQTIREMREYCKNEKVYNFADLMDYASENNESWFTALCTYASALMVRYVRSLEYKEEQTHKKHMKKLNDEYEAAKADAKRQGEQWEAQKRRFDAWRKEKERMGWRWDEKLNDWTRKE